jgi:hypothetical protein
MRPPIQLAAFALLAALVAMAPAGAAAAPPARLTLVACAPGFPGTTAEAQPAMDALAAALARRAGLPADGLAAVYHSAEAEGVARLGAPDAAVALVSLPFFLEHGAALGLAPRLQVELVTGGALERWSLVARKGRVTAPADLADLAILSTAGYSPAFVRGAVAAWGRLPASTTVVQTAQVLSSLRKAAGGAPLALLLDGAQAEALPTLPFAAELEVVARSAPLPTSVVATVGTRLSPSAWSTLEKAFLSLHADPAGAQALAGARMARFAPLDPAALAAARSLAPGGQR